MADDSVNWTSRPTTEAKTVRSADQRTELRLMNWIPARSAYVRTQSACNLSGP